MSTLLTRLKRVSSQLPAGTIPIGLGLFINGIVTYAFLILPVRTDRIDKVQLGFLTNLWFLTFTLAPGVLMPLEQELGRAISARMHHGLGSLPLVKRAAALAAGLVAILTVLALAFAPLYLKKGFGGSTTMLAIFVVSLPTYAAYYLLRGVLSGSHTFKSYGWLLGAEGILRIGMCIALIVLGASGESWYSATLILAPMLTVMWLIKKEHRVVTPGPSAPWSELTNALGFLIIGQLFAQVLMNAAPIAASFLGTTDADHQDATVYKNGFLIARVPLYLFAAVQAALLPQLSRLIAAGKVNEFRNGMKKVFLIITAVTLSFTIGAGALGPFVIRTLYGADFNLPRLTFVLLGLASGAFMFATALAQGLIAIARYKDVAVVWFLGALTFVAALPLAHEIQLKVNIAFLLGSCVSALLSALYLERRLQHLSPGPHTEFLRDDAELMIEP